MGWMQGRAPDGCFACWYRWADIVSSVPVLVLRASLDRRWAGRWSEEGDDSSAADEGVVRERLGPMETGDPYLGGVLYCTVPV